MKTTEECYRISGVNHPPCYGRRPPGSSIASKIEVFKKDTFENDSRPIQLPYSVRLLVVGAVLPENVLRESAITLKGNPHGVMGCSGILSHRPERLE